MESDEERSTIELFKKSAPLIIPSIQSIDCQQKQNHEDLISVQSDEFPKTNICDHDVCFLVENKLTEVKDTKLKLKAFQENDMDLQFSHPSTIANSDEAIAIFTGITDHNFLLKDCQQTSESCLIKEKNDNSHLSNAEFTLSNFLEENQEVMNSNLLKQDGFSFLPAINNINSQKDDQDFKQPESLIVKRMEDNQSPVDVLSSEQQEVSIGDENWFNLFFESFDDKYSGYAKNLVIAEQIIKQYEHDTNSKFCVWNSPKNFGNTTLDSNVSRKIFFNAKKVPYLVLSSKRYSCEHGKDRHKFDKIRKKEKNTSLQTCKETRSITKKVDCAAVVLLRELLLFPQLKINRNTHWERRMISTNIRAWLAKKSNENLSFLRYIHVCLPKVTDHTNHQDIEHREAVHPVIIDKIYDMIWQNENIAVDSLKEKIKSYALKQFSEGSTLYPSKRRRFSPSATDLKYMITKAKRLSVVSSEDKLKTSELIEQLSETKPSHKFFLCDQFSNVSSCNSNTGRYSLPMKSRQSRILFISQNVRSQALLYRYGEQVYFTKLSRSFVLVPYDVFCIYVGTNVDFQPIALAICQNYNADVLQRLFHHFQNWNTFWSPTSLFTDKSLIDDVSFIFPECTVYVSKASREREWVTSLGQFNTNSKEIILNLLQNIGDATTDEILCDALRKLEISNEWKTNEQFAKWFTEHWLPCLQRWICPQGLFCNKFRMCDEESCLKEFNIKPFTNSNCTSWFPRLIDDLVAAMERSYKRYTELNERCDKDNAESEQNFSRHLLYLRLPVKQYINDKMSKAQSMNCTYEAIEYGVYSLTEMTTMKSFTVSFGCATTENSLVSCDCPDWKSYHLPCSHMCYIFHHEDVWSFNRLPVQYRCNPFLTVDTESLTVKRTLIEGPETPDTSRKRHCSYSNNCIETEESSMLQKKFDQGARRRKTQANPAENEKR